MENKRQRLGTFKQFLHKQRMKQINEAKVNIECDWWDACIVEVMQELETECLGILDWDVIIKYCKDKWAILGRPLPQPEYDDNILTQHIKDLIFQFHGDSFYTDWKCDVGWDNQQVHSKGLVIEELAAVVLDKVREKTNPEGEPDTGDTTGTLYDREKTTLVPMTPVPSYDCEDEYCADLPYEYESHKVKPVKKFNEYSKMLKESVVIMDAPDHDACIDYCINRIIKETGGLDPEVLLVSALDAATPQVKARLVTLYVRPMVKDYLSTEGVHLLTNNANDDGKGGLPEVVINDAVEGLCDDLADEVMLKIAKENGIEYEEVE